MKKPLVLKTAWESYDWDAKAQAFRKSKQVGYTLVEFDDKTYVIESDEDGSLTLSNTTAPWIMGSDPRHTELAAKFIGHEFLQIVKDNPLVDAS